MATNSLTALITGGTSGIGRATAKQLATLGIHVLVVGRNAKRGNETLAEIHGREETQILYRLIFETCRAHRSGKASPLRPRGIIGIQECRRP